MGSSCLKQQQPETQGAADVKPTYMFPTADLYIQSMVSLEESMVKRRGSERCIAAPWDTWARGPLSFLPTSRRCACSQVKGEGKGSQLQH